MRGFAAICGGLVGVIAALLLLAAPAYAGSGANDVVAFRASAPTLNFVDATWDNSAPYPLHFGSFTGDVHVLEDGTNLYIGIRVNDPSTTAPTSAIYFDNTDNGTVDPGDNEVQFDGTTFLDQSASGPGFALAPDGHSDGSAAQQDDTSAGTWHIIYVIPLCSGDQQDFCVQLPSFGQPGVRLGFAMVYNGTSYPVDPGTASAFDNFVFQPPSTPPPPPQPTIDLTNGDGLEFMKQLSNGADLVYFNGNHAGSFRLSVPATDGGHTITSASFPSQLTNGAGWEIGSPDALGETFFFPQSAPTPSSFDVTSTDSNSQTSVARTVGFQSDGNPPTGGLDCQPVTCSNPNGPVRVTVVASDGQGGSGIAQIRYTTDGTAASATNGALIQPGGAFLVTTPSAVSTWAVDNVGNGGSVGSASNVAGHAAPAALTWNYASDFQDLSNPGPDLYGNPGVWSYGEVPVATQHDMSTSTVYPQFNGGVQECWHSATLEFATPDDCVQSTPSGLQTDIDPASTRDTFIAWKSPISGTVSVTGGFADADIGGGDGIAWFVDKNGTTLDSGSFGNTNPPGSSSFSPSLQSVQVSPGDTLTFLVNPQGSLQFDSTTADITITQLAPPPPPATNGRIVYDEMTPVVGGGTATDVFSANPDGTHVRQLTNQPGPDEGAQYSPDGKKIVWGSFGGDAASTMNVWVMNSDGSGAQPLTTDVAPASDSVPTYSPDGTKIAYIHDDGAGDRNVMVMDANGGNAHSVTQPSTLNDSNPTWSPDGKRIAYAENDAGGSDIFISNADGTGTPVNLTSHPAIGNSDPSWSPDGTKIAYDATFDSRIGVEGSDTPFPQVQVINADGTGQKTISPTSAAAALWVSDPSWSPDGKQIAFTVSPNDDFNAFEITTMNADGTSVQPVTSNSAYDGFPNWGTEALDTGGTGLAPSSVVSHPSAAMVPLNTIVTDTATVSSNGVAGIPQGTVTFSICALLTAPSGCASGGSQLGQPQAIDGAGGPVVSPQFLPDGPGIYCFRADYSGDGQFAASSDGSPGECFQVGTPQSGPTYTVNTVADHSDATGCTVDDCSLHEAIAAANAAGVPATIDFSIVPTGPQTIALTSALPAATVKVTIDGLSQPGSLAGPGIALDGTALPAATDGLVIKGQSSSVRGLAFENIPGNAIDVEANRTLVTQVLIGQTQLGGVIFHNGGDGIFVQGAFNAQITNSTIAANLGAGIHIGSKAANTVITGNTIGSPTGGDLGLPGNSGAGVLIDQTSSSTQVGGTGQGDGNRIAFNGGPGVSVASQHNAILGNSIDQNGGGGIKLGTTGNQLQPPPLLAAVHESGHQLTIIGKFLAPGDTYRLEYFLNRACIDAPALGPDEGATFIGSSQVVVNAGGEAAINATIDISNVPPSAGSVVTATATSSTNNTSAFSARCITITQSGTATSATLSLTTNTQATTPGASAIPLADIPPTAFGNSTVDSNGNTASAPLGAIPLGAIPLGAIPLGAIPLGAIPLGAIGFNAQTLSEDGLGGVPLNTIPLKAPLSWENELSTTPLAGLPIQTLTLNDVLKPGNTPANLTTAGPNAIGLKDIDLSLSPLGAIPLGAIALGSAPLGAIPISGDASKTRDQNDADWCTQIKAIPGFSQFDCSNFSTQTVMGVAIQGVPLGAIPLGAIPLGAIPLGAIPLGAIPLGAIDLADSPLGAIPLGAINLADTPLGAIALRDLPLGAIPLGAIPLGAIPVLSAVCTGSVCTQAGATLADAFNANAIPSTATLADLSTYGSAVLSDLAAYLQAHPTIEIKDVVPGLPADTTLRDLLIALMGGTPPSWEAFPLSGLQAFANGAGASGGNVTYNATFSLAGTGNAIATLKVTPPNGAFYVPGSAVLNDTTAQTSTPLGDPDAGGTGLSWTLDSLVYGDSYTLSFHLRPGFQLGSEQASATLSTNGVADQVSSASVTVGDTFEANNTPAAAPSINPGTLYVSYIGNGKDLDYSTLHIDPTTAPAGTRIKIFLSHLKSDEDLAVFGPGEAPLRSAPASAIPLGAIAAGDQSVQLGEAGQALAPDTAQDLPFGALPAGDRLLGVSDNRGTADEEVDITSTGLTGDLLIQVSSYDGHPTVDPYVLRVEEDQPPALPPCTQSPPSHPGGVSEAPMPTNASIPSTAQTLILFNEQRIRQYYDDGTTDWGHEVYSRLQAYAARSDVNGVIVPVDENPGVAAAYGTWDNNLCSPSAANGVVRAIGSLLDTLQAGHNFKNLVIVGAENVIPMARLVDQTQQANELGFRSTFGFVNNEYVGAVAAGDLLSDDPYADPDPQPFLGGFLYVPKLAMGRLVETPADIDRQLDTYDNVNNGLVNPQTKFVTGYDFLTDGSQAVDSALGRSAPVANQINDTWTADQLRAGVFPTTGTGAQIDSLNAHYDQHRALSAQGNTLHDESAPNLYTTANVTPLGANAVLNRIIFTMGCHAGFSLFDGLNFGSGLPSDFATDWPQAYMEGGAIEFMGNTGYGLGDTAAVAYSERLNQLFAQRLNGTMSIGEALEYAKQEYVGDLGVVSVYDAKVGNEATLYGLPTYRLGTGTPPAAPASAPTHTDSATGLTAVDFNVTPTFTLHPPVAAGIGSYYSANDPNGLGTQVTNRRPIEPLTTLDVTEPNTVAHGVLLTGLASHNAGTAFNVAFSRVTDDQSGIEPQLQGIVDFPASIQSLATIATPNGQRQRAVLIAGHFASGASAAVGTQRLYDTLAGTVLYSTSSDFVRPTIRNVQISQVGSTVGFAADIADLDASGAPGTIKEALVLYLDGSGIWQRANLTCVNGRCSGGGPLTGTSVDYIIEGVDAGGNVGVNADKAATANVTPPQNGGHITVTYSATPSSGWYTSSPLTATLHSDSGASLSSSLDGGAYVDGASVTVSGDGLHTLDVRASDGSTASFLVPIDTLAPTISIFSPVDGSYLLAGDVVKADYSCSDAGSGLAATGGCVGPVASGAAIDNTAGNKTFTVNAKDALNHTSSKSVSYQVWPFTGFFSPVDNAPTINVGKAGSAIPVKFSLGGNRGLTFGTFGSKKVDCVSDAPQDVIETTVTAGGSSLAYDSTSNQYTYVWKTDPSWTGTCRDFTITFTNGDTRTARFKFK